jgi:hypothetical protein
VKKILGPKREEATGNGDNMQRKDLLNTVINLWWLNQRHRHTE